MSDAWLTIGALAAGTAIIRGVGPALLGARELPRPVQDVIALVAPALLAALVAVQTVGAPEGGSYELDARVPGLVAAAAALLAGASMLPTVAVATVVTALARALL